MSRFIRVTVRDEKNQCDDAWYINPDHIAALRTSRGIGDRASIELVTGTIVPALESVQKIMGQIDQIGMLLPGPV